MLQLNNISFRYDQASPLLFDNFSFSAEQGDIVAVKGKSGSGKTTLFNIISSVIPKIFNEDLSGSIIHNGVDISKLSLPEVSPRISMLMQAPDNQLFFPIVEQELAFGPENLKISADDVIKRIDDVLQRLKIEKLRFEETSQLSFGQKKIVTLASIITLSPEIYLLDEPFAGLSQEYVGLVLNEIVTLSNNGKTIFIASHTDEITKIANKAIDMDKLNEKH